jgi:hypothetical protein
MPTQCAYHIELAGGCVAVAPSRQRPRALVHFCGGAAAGAAPSLTYGLLVDSLADGGYTVVCTPYNLTFHHDRCARAVHAAFGAAVAELRADRERHWAAPAGAPVHGVGHSNGALLHLLMGAMCAPPYASAALLSFNNRPVGGAVPVPLAPVQAAVQALRGGGPSLEQVVASAATEAVSSLLGLARDAGAQEGALRALRQAAPALAQFGGVFDEVGDGQMDFTPAPEATRALVDAQYAVPRTLVVRFSDDSIDQSPEVAALLLGRGGGGGGGAARGSVAELALPGTHLTPLGAAPQWRPGGAFSPADAAAQAVLAAAAGDGRRLAGRLLEWLDAASPR